MTEIEGLACEVAGRGGNSGRWEREAREGGARPESRRSRGGQPQESEGRRDRARGPERGRDVVKSEEAGGRKREADHRRG